MQWKDLSIIWKISQNKHHSSCISQSLRPLSFNRQQLIWHIILNFLRQKSVTGRQNKLLDLEATKELFFFKGFFQISQQKLQQNNTAAAGLCHAGSCYWIKADTKMCHKPYYRHPFSFPSKSKHLTSVSKAAYSGKVCSTCRTTEVRCPSIPAPTQHLSNCTKDHAGWSPFFLPRCVPDMGRSKQHPQPISIFRSNTNPI